MKVFFARWAVTCYLILIFIAASWSLFHPRLFRVHDYIHGARIAEMQRALADGQFPVRWTENFGYGYGMPLFEFYAPLPTYIGVFIYNVTTDLSLSVKLLFLIANIGTVIGGYVLGKKLFGQTGGVVLSAALTLAPYRAVNLFVRGALSEAWAIMFLPLILFFGLTILESAPEKHNRQGFAFLGLVLSLTGLMLTHNLTTLMFVPISFAFLVSYQLGRELIEKKLSQVAHKNYLWLTVAYLLAGGLAAFYMLPAVMEKDFTQINSIVSGYFSYEYHFLYIRQFFQPNWGYEGSSWGPEDTISFFLGWGQLLGLGLVGLLSVKNLFRLWQQGGLKVKLGDAEFGRKELFFLTLTGLFLLLALYLTLLKSKWLWDLIPVLPFIQFPWRWLSLVILFTALLVAFGTRLIGHTLGVWLYLTIIVLGVLINAQYFRPEKYLSDDQEYYYADAKRIREEMSDTLPDYLPLHLKVASPSAKLMPDFNTTKGNDDYLSPRAGNLILIGDTLSVKSLEVVVDRGHHKIIRVELKAPTELTFATAYFPGWQTQVDQAAPTNAIANDQGLITVAVPGGWHTVELELVQTPIRMAADLISVVSLIGFIVSMYVIKKYE